MSLMWSDKYRPKDLSALDYHKDQATDLKNLTKDGDFPHLLVYGPLGAGKKTRIMCMLRELYGAGIDRLKSETLTVTTPSNKKLEITTVNSNHHIEVNPSDVGIYDRVVIMDIIKSVAQTQQLNAGGAPQHDFKVILLTDVDDLTKDAQHALRRTMEKYIANCRIVLCATTISRVIPAIRSRCLCIRVPAPTHDEITAILRDTCTKEDVVLPAALADRIAVKCDRNLRRALLMLEACKVQQYPFNRAQDIAEPDWQLFIRRLAAKVLKEQNVAVLMSVREDFYELITHGIPTDILFRTLLDELLENCDIGMTRQVVEQAALYDHRMTQGNKQIFHLEAFIAKFMCIYQNMVQEFMNVDGEF